MMFKCNMTYSREQLCEIMNITLTSNACSKIEEKFTTYGVEYTKKGKGSSAQYSILKIGYPFKAYCVFEYKMPYNMDFLKLRTLFIEFLTNPDFAGCSQEAMEEHFRGTSLEISRQTIGKDLQRIYKIGNMQPNEYRYCLVYKEKGIQTHKDITKEVYCSAWRCYFDEKENWMKNAQSPEELSQTTRHAYEYMRTKFGGSPRKYAIYESCAWDEYKINILLNYAIDELDKEGEQRE